jgi:CBS domain-containing protein
MTREPITVPQETTIGELCDLLQVKNINGAPVVDSSGRLVGVVTQEDIIYGAMGHPDPGPAARGGAPDGPGRGGTEPDRGAPAGRGGRTRRIGKGPERARRVVAMLRERGLGEAPPAGPRPGERSFWSDLRPPDPMSLPVRSIMTSPAISAEEDTPVADLCRVMWSLRIHRVPILRQGKVTGLVSSMDLCRAILEGKIKV